MSTALGANGTTWSEFGADVPRFSGTSRRLLVEGQRTNLNTNPRGEGGSGTTMPTGWTPSFGGLAITSVTQTTRNGILGVALRFAGTPTSTGGQTIQQFGNTEVVAIGTSVTNQIFAELLAGTLTNVSGFALRCNVEGGSTTFTPGAFANIQNVRVTTGTSSSTQVRWHYNDTVTPVDFTIFLGGASREHAAFCSTPILPAVGTPAASTHGADLISASLASLSIGANGACTVLWSGVIPQNAPAGARQSIVQIDDGTAANRYIWSNEAGGATIAVTRVTGGAASGVAAGSMTAGTPFASGISLNGSGRAAISQSGGAIFSVTGGPTSLTTLRLGSNVASAENMFGETARLSILPYALSDAALQAAVAAFPTS